MTDRERVIKGLECCLGAIDCDIEPNKDCPYNGMCLCAMALRFDVLALLEEQEAKNGYWINPTSQDCHCSECGEQPVHEPGESVPLYNFCPYCGAKMEVKWNE